MNFFEDAAPPQIAKIIRSPDPLPFFYTSTDAPLLFLAGSIEQGTADEWQAETISELSDQYVTILDPRRDNWDTTISDDLDRLREQVTWELTGLQEADCVLMHFDPKTKSPISLLELGLLIGSDTTVFVSCSPEFYRYGNVKITCEMYDVPVYNSLSDALVEIKKFLHGYNEVAK